MKKWAIELFENNNGSVPVLDFIQSLPPKHQAKIEREIDLLEEFGINLSYPHTGKIKGERYMGLWELRIQLANDISRIFYFLQTPRTFVLLHGFIKKTNKTPSSELEIALSRMKQYQGR